MEWNIYWDIFHDWKYPCTVIGCLAIGFAAGFYECKLMYEKKMLKEAFRLAITNTIE